MSYTPKYPTLIAALFETEMQIAVNYKDKTANRMLLVTMRDLIDFVKKTEEAHNKDEKATLMTDRHQLLFELDMIGYTCADSIKMFEGEGINSSTPNKVLIGNDPIQVTLTDGDRIHLINSFIDSFLANTKKVTETTLYHEPTMRYMLQNLAEVISLEISEDENPTVHAGIKNAKEFDAKLNELGISGGLTIGEHLTITEDDEMINSFLKVLYADRVGKSNIFGNN